MAVKLFSCSTQLNTKFIMLITVKMPTIVGILTVISMINCGILTVISMINTISESLKLRRVLFFSILVFMSS